MILNFKRGNSKEYITALILLKLAAIGLHNKGINQWAIWLQPDEVKINWVKEGFEAGEFYLVKTETNELAGMFRLMKEDELYWGKQLQQARYIHSLVVTEKFKGKNIGKQIMQQIEEQVKASGINLLKLDCIASNTALCSYYESQGFKKTGTKQMTHSLNNLFEKQLMT